MFNAICPVIGSQKCFPFYLTGIGTSEPEGHIIRESGNISHQILFTTEGEGIVEIDNKSYVNKRGSIFYVASGVSHEYYPVDKDWTTYWVVFRGDNLDELMTNLGFPKYICKTTPAIEDIQKKFSMIYSVAQLSIHGEEKCSLLIYDYIMTIRKVLLLNMDLSFGSIINNAIIYINENYNKDISLQELAELCNISKQHVCRVFKIETGMRPLEYLAQKRMSIAKVLLYSTDHNITEIGKEVGYEDPTYFGMVFKKYEGISPSEYRKSGKNIFF